MSDRGFDYHAIHVMAVISSSSDDLGCLLLECVDSLNTRNTFFCGLYRCLTCFNRLSLFTTCANASTTALRIFARDSELRTLPGFSLNPYRVSHFRFHGLKEHKVLARTEAHVPWYSVAVPCALVDLLIKERMPAKLGDCVPEHRLPRVIVYNPPVSSPSPPLDHTPILTRTPNRNPHPRLGVEYRIDQLLQYVKKEEKKAKSKYKDVLRLNQELQIRAVKEIGLSGGGISTNTNSPRSYDDQGPRYIEKIEGVTGEGYRFHQRVCAFCGDTTAKRSS